MKSNLIATEPRIFEESKAMVESTVYTRSLSRFGQSCAYVDLFIKATANHGADPSAAGAFYKLIEEIELIMDSKNVLDRMSGNDLYNLNTCLQGAAIETAAPVGTTAQSFARLRIWLIDPRSSLADQRKAARDLGKLTNFTLRFKTGVFEDVWADGTLAVSSMDYTIVLGDIPGAIIDGPVVNVFRKQSYTMNGNAQEDEKWQEEGAFLKRMMVLGYDGDALSDSVITTLGLRLGGKTEIIQRLSWLLHRSRTIDYTGLDASLLPTGVTFISISEKGQPRVLLGQRQSATPLINGTNAKTIVFVLNQHHSKKSFFGRK